MTLSVCQKCGGHIPLGPDATNRCEKCGASVWLEVYGEPVQRQVAKIVARLAEAERLLREADAELDRWDDDKTGRRDFELEAKIDAFLGKSP